jgi:hypothetical protein
VDSLTRDLLRALYWTADDCHCATPRAGADFTLVK